MKFCLLGDGSVGKTSIRENFIGREFRSTYLQTIGADFSTRYIKIDEQEYKVQIWDLAGQQHFRSVRKLYYKGSHGFIIVFDLTRLSSLENIIYWIYEAFNKIDEAPIPIVILGNKADIWNETEAGHVSLKSIKEVIKKIEETTMEGLKIPYLETSAKTGQNIQEAFNTMAEKIIDFAK
jgi:small GTP-binding protein